MIDRDAVTLTPPPPAERDLEAEHKTLITQFADHPDPKVRVLAHISTRQFELSERMSAMQKSIDDGMGVLKKLMTDGFSELRDRIRDLDDGFEEVEERTSELEQRYKGNGSSSSFEQ